METENGEILDSLSEFDESEHSVADELEVSDLPDEKEQVEHRDDQGIVFRVDNKLISNNKYEINGYTYETDDHGRIQSVSGFLHIKSHDGRKPIRDSMDTIGNGDQRETDERGHLIGDQFDGSNGMENMIPQDMTLNRGEYKNMENELAKQVKSGKEVYVEIEPQYDGDSRRPKALLVQYSIDGVEQTPRFFRNGG